MKVVPLHQDRSSICGANLPSGATFDLAYRLDEPIWVFDIDNAKVLLANGPACELWEAKDEAELTQRDMGATMSETVRKRLLQYQTDFETTDSVFTEMWTLYPNDTPRNVMVSFKAFRLNDGRMAMLCEAANETKDDPENVRSAEALLYTDVMVALFDLEGPPLYLNPSARNTFVAPITGFQNLFVAPETYTTILAGLEDKGEYRTISRIFTAKGQMWIDLSVKYCSDAVTGRPAILATATDVSSLKEARDKARHLANRDQLTDLYNRTYLQNHMSQMRHRSGLGQCSLIFLDVDRFKTINDRYGHDAGDYVLKQIASRLRVNLRDNDLIVRLGGDEMVVLMENIKGREHVEAMTGRICEAISQPIGYQKSIIDVAVSVGISMFEPHSVDFTELLREADIALYASKQAGRNRWTFYTDEMGIAAKARDDLEMELKVALERDQFVLHYQPRLDTSTGKVISVEGLVRWNHPDRGLLQPGAFIPLCEENGLIEQLGRRVLEMGCEQAIQWQSEGLDIQVSLNVSPRQFLDETFLDTLENLANQPGFPVGKIELEITENALFGDHEMIAEKLRLITEMGYHIAIDDFGTGYSNLSYISRFPLHCLKIDRSFIDQLPGSGPIVRLILTLGQQIGATVVSEGVETIEQLDWLTENRCSQAQGYFISKPMPPDALNSFLAA